MCNENGEIFLFELICFISWLLVGLIYFYGVMDYGDVVEDEWFIVYIIWELIKLNVVVWVCVVDVDGEFFLVEVVNVLFKWISLEIDCNCVWIYKG